MAVGLREESTTLVIGSGIDFADRGVHKLKGVPGTRKLFAVTE
jgi:hypothetical protein